MAAGRRPPSIGRLFRSMPSLAITVTFAACSLTEPNDDPFRLAGTVRSAYSDTPIAGARVSLVTRPSWGSTQEVLGTTTTDSLGHYAFTARQRTGKVPFSNCETLSIDVEADLYEPRWNWFGEPEVACTADLQTHDFRLVPYAVALSVLPDSATVRVGESVTLTATITNADGSDGSAERLRDMWGGSRFVDRRAYSAGPCGVVNESLRGTTATYHAPDAVPTDSCGGSAPGEVKLSLEAGQVDTVHFTIVP